MAKSKDIKAMGKEERDKRLQELKMELVKARVESSKTGSAKIGEIKKHIARLLTFNKSELKAEELNKK